MPRNLGLEAIAPLGQTNRGRCLLRDTLLPKLLAGELRVKAAEKLVEATA